MTAPLPPGREQEIRERLGRATTDRRLRGHAGQAVWVQNYAADVQALLDEVGRLRGAASTMAGSSERFFNLLQEATADRDRLAQRVSELEGVLEGFAVPQAELLLEKAASPEARDICERVLVQLRSILHPATGGEAEGGG